jgi:hypothetical protein
MIEPGMSTHGILNEPTGAPIAPPLDAPSSVRETITPDALQFAEANGLTAALSLIADEIRRYIPKLEGISIVRSVGPEIENYVLIFFEIKTSAEIEELREAEEKVWDAMFEILTPEQLEFVGGTINRF